MKTALELVGVSKRYGRRQALDGLSLSVPEGSLFGLVGSNGAGKTTAMAIVTGIVQADGGTINVLGGGSFQPAVHAGRVTVLPQDALLPREARIGELLAFYADLQGVPRQQIDTCVRQMLQMVHLEDRARSPVRTLSHGMMRRVTIAQAFLGDPDLVLLDEPLSGLDPREVQNARTFLRQRRPGQTVIISSHNLYEIEKLCDRVAFIEKGKTVLQDSLDSVTGRGHAVRYRLAPSPWDLAGLQARLPGTLLELSAASDLLTCRFAVPARTLEEVNGIVVRYLLEAGVGIREIQCGGELEQVYLDRTESAVSRVNTP